MVYLLLNCDEYLAAGRIAEFKAALGDAEMASLNTAEIDGARTHAADILGQAAMMPFLAPRRLLIVRGYLGQLEKRMAQSKSATSAAHTEAAHFLRGLAQLGESCDLVLVEPSLDKRRALWKGFSAPADKGDSGDKGEPGDKGGDQAVPGLQEVSKKGVVQLEELGAPDLRALPGYVQQRAKSKSIAIDGRAVQTLANYVGANLRQLDNELEKLASYASGRPVSVEDIEILVSDASEAMIWTLTDALSQRNPRGAMEALQRMRRHDANPFYLLTMIARQYRIILKVKEAMAEAGGRPGNEYDIAKLVGEKPFPVKKAMGQANGYSFEELTHVLDRLLEADFAMKTGADADTELDVLIVELTRRAQSRPQPARFPS